MSPRARRRVDRNGDPLDGLVNLFDLGIVLSVAFLLAALASIDLTSAVTQQEPGSRPLPPGELTPLPSPGPTASGSGVPVGTVYRLPDGRLVYVSPTPPP